jgi:putative peptide zinc metalloprotease protein
VTEASASSSDSAGLAQSTHREPSEAIGDEPPEFTEADVAGLRPARESWSEESLHSRFVDVSVLMEAEEATIGRPSTGSFVTVPPIGGRIVLWFQGGLPLHEVERRATAELGEWVDVLAFIDDLSQEGILANAVEQLSNVARVKRRHRSWPSRSARLLFTPVARVFYAACACWSVVLLLADPEVRPNAESPWVFPDPFLSLLFAFICYLALTVVHEAWHWLSCLARGLPVKFRVSQRGLILVMETDVSAVMTLPRGERYIVYMSGMCVDVVILATCLSLIYGSQRGLVVLPPMLIRTLALAAWIKCYQLVIQFAVFLRTDLYAAMATCLRTHSLAAATSLYLRLRVFGANHSAADKWQGVSDRDRVVAQKFAIAYVMGATLLVLYWCAFVLPSVAIIVTWTFGGIAQAKFLSIDQIEGWAVLAMVAMDILLPVVLSRRERRLRRLGRLT